LVVGPLVVLTVFGKPVTIGGDFRFRRGFMSSSEKMNPLKSELKVQSIAPSISRRSFGRIAAGVGAGAGLAASLGGS